MVRKIIGGYFLFCAVIAPFALGQQGKAVEGVLCACVCALIAYFVFPKSKWVKRRKAAKRAAKQAELDAKRAAQELRLARELASLSGEHAVGLPLAQGAACVLYFDDEVVTISGGGNEFNLAYAKITDISVHSDVEIQKSYVSSVGGAVGGAMLFGTLGAMVGGRAKEKQSEVIEYYFIITYLKDGAVDHLSFRVDDNAKAQMVADRHRGKISKTTNVTTL